MPMTILVIDRQLWTVNCGEVFDDGSTRSDTVRAVLCAANCTITRTARSVVRILLFYSCILMTFTL